MGCKLSISVVHPLQKSPKYIKKKKRDSPNLKESQIQLDIPDDSDCDSYQTLYIDTPPDSERKRV